MYYPGAPGQYGRPPNYGGYPPSNAPPGMAPPGIVPPPGVAAPGMAPPGMLNAPTSQAGRGSGIPPNFQPPPGMNFNAPVIRLGTTGPSGPGGHGARGGGNAEPMSAGGTRRPGLGSGMDQRGSMARENMMSLAPPTKEEIARTIFIGNITEGVGGDEGLERILRCAGNLRRWARCTDSENQPCKFGFAEYEDAESLETAAEIFQDIQVPVKLPEKKSQSEPKAATDDDTKTEADGDVKMDDPIEMTTLLVVVDDASKKYAEEWKERRNESPETVQFRMDSAKEALEGVLASLLRPQEQSTIDDNMDLQNIQGSANGNAEVLTIPITAEDDLSDIPAGMREIVAAEIAAFRERSNRRDMERLKREEEIEAAERARAMGGSQPSASATGPAGGANGIPLGPRADRGLHGAPTGPRGMQGSQMPKDYQGHATFVNGGTMNGGVIKRDDDDLPGTDSDIERERQEKINAEREVKYLDAERRWLNRERGREAALKREEDREKSEKATHEREKEKMMRMLTEWNDDTVASLKTDDYYIDRSAWVRNRKDAHDREAERDRLDRELEKREAEWEQQQKDQAGRMADDFLSRQAEEMERAHAAPAGPTPFKMSLSLGQKKSDAGPKRRTAAEVENLLEDEEDEEVRTAKPRAIIPLAPAEMATMSEEDRKAAARQLAADIPTDHEGLANWPVRWESLDEGVVEEQLVPFVEKKIVELLGVQEQMLVDVVQDHIHKKGKMGELITELEGALDEEAAGLVKKLWRMIIFFSESEKRGLST